MRQGAGEVSGPSSAAPGTTIEVTVSTGDSVVKVTTGSGTPATYPVQNGKAQVPVPPGVSPGGDFWVYVGSGANIKIMRVEVVQP